MLITTVAAARRLDVSDRRIRQLIAEGKIKAVKVGVYKVCNLIEEADCHYEKSLGVENKEEIREDETQNKNYTPNNGNRAKARNSQTRGRIG